MNIEYGTGSRIYTIGVSGEATDGVAFEVPLVDTEGNLVDCNYVDVSMVADGNAAGETVFVTCELSGIGKVSPAVNKGSVSGTSFQGLSPKATCGFTLVAAGVSDKNNSTYCWHGFRTDTVKGLKFTAVAPNKDEKVDLAINYGNLIAYRKNDIGGNFDIGS